MKTTKYFGAQIKRASKLYPSILAVTVLLIVCIALSCVLIINNSTNEEDKQKFTLGICGDLSDTNLDIGITAIQNLDTSRFSIDMITIESEDEAKKMLKDGEIAGYVRIPPDFVRSVIRMENKPVAYVSNNSPMNFGTLLVNEMAQNISDTVSESQKGIYGLQRLSKEHGKNENYHENIVNLNAKYISSVLNRNESIDIENLGISDGLSAGGYFVCGGVMIFLLLWGISCNSVLSKKDRSLEKLLSSKGQSVFTQTLSEYSVFFLITLFTVMLITVIAGIATQYVNTGIEELDYKYVSDYVMYVVKIIPVLLMITSLQFLFHELINGTVSVVLTQFVFAIGTGYVCGCLYPSYFFPETVQKAAAFLPTGVGVSYMRQTMSHTLTSFSFFGVIIYFVLFFGTAVFARRLRNAGDRK